MESNGVHFALKKKEFGKVDILNDCLPVHAMIPPDYSLSTGIDEVAWAFSLSGSFCLKTYFHLQYERRFSQLHYVWHLWIPPKVSIFAWKLCKRAVPTDDRIAEVGIQLASKCLCCLAPKCETITHLFLLGDAASLVWSFFGPLCNKPTAHSLTQLYKFWIVDSDAKSQLGCLAIAIFLWGIWELWKHCNTKRHERHPPDLIRTISYKVSKHLVHVTPTVAASYEERIALQALCVTIKEPIRKPRSWVAWTPGHGITVNFEVSSDAKKGSAVLRDTLGSFLFAYVIDVDLLCRDFNLIHLVDRTMAMCEEKQVAVDSLQVPSKSVVRWLKESSNWPWFIKHKLRRCKKCVQHTSISQVAKGVNKCAKALLKASPGWYNELRRLPGEFFLQARLDARGTRYLVDVIEIDPG